MPRVTEFEIHNTDVARFKQCRRSWHWASPLRCNLDPIGKYAPFFVGSMVHHGLEHWYKRQQTPEGSIYEYFCANTTAAERLDLDICKQYDLAVGMCDHYLTWQKHDQTWLADKHFKFVAPEQEFKTLLWRNSRKRIWLAGKFDGVVYHYPSQQYYLWEIKTTRSIAEREKMLALDEQTNAYANAAQTVLGYPIAGIIYTLMRKKIPTTPDVLKNGMLSKNKAMDTTPEQYLATILAHHGEQATRQFISLHYADFIDQLCQEPNKFFRRLIVKRSQAELDTARRDLLAVAQDMINPNIPLYATGGYHCNYCLFRDPCIAYNQARNYQEILARGYAERQQEGVTDED